ncbi:hypothetical protein ACFOZ0_27370 [Streptomyces yaanensis]|uniref:Uncharacterized protein n=1 Tax=Streptomyces yaanensis TaxID=1142239 RepID=A0ABV7SJ14_9ACTN|nr:hypothetical protein [Streptomyces sp. CGMCC 4.7035]WNB97057.1 hypothetical protein Q2K21_02645 [Streptomyces sp. CGMCC 4.7035]
MRIGSWGQVQSWFRQGIFKDAHLRTHLEAIKSLQPQPQEVYAHDYLYACLSVLDAKAQVLLAYDGFLVAAASVVLTILPGGTGSTALLVAALIASGLSGALSLTVVSVHWTDTQDMEHADAVFPRLLEIRNRRTAYYRISWGIAQAASLLLVCGVLVHLLYR